MPHEKVTGCEDRYRLTVAPRFQLGRTFVGRIDRNSGVEHSGESFQPRDDWRSLNAQDLSALVKEVLGAGAVLPATHLGLLQIPEHIRGAWWREAEKSGGSEGFERVFSALIEFLRFKRLPFPERVHLEVAVNAPDLASTRAVSSGARQGLAYCDRPAVPKGRARQALGLVNLGDEAGFVVLLDLPPSTLAARLEAAGESGAGALSADSLVNRYFKVFPRQSLFRLRLEPGEGLWLSPHGVVHDGWTHGKRDLDVVLSVRAEVGDATHEAVEGARAG
ncbi:MAG TPA: hypothetical protein VK714_08425 [Myxococcota bacterium]|nr:hypothetical protein [Myxococcota bacterium]